MITTVAKPRVHVAECPTVPLWAGQSRFGGKCPASRGDLARDAFCPALGKKVTCATARPTCRMQSALSCIMSEHENRTGRYTTKDRARRATKHAYTCTHETVPMPKSDGMYCRPFFATSHAH